MITQELFHALLHRRVRQGAAQLCKRLAAMFTQTVIYGMHTRVCKDGMPRVGSFLRRIDREDAQPALPRHEKTHDLRRRTEVKCRKLLCGCKQRGGEPRLLIDRRNDLSQTVPPIPRRIIGTYTGDEALLADIAERDEYAPARCDLREPLRQNIGELLRNALDRNVDIDIRNGHMFTFSPKKPLHESIRATAPFHFAIYEAISA